MVSLYSLEAVAPHPHKGIDIDIDMYIIYMLYIYMLYIQYIYIGDCRMSQFIHYV